MTPPEAPDSKTGTTPPAGFVRPGDAPPIETITKRADFLAAARAHRQGSKAMMVQARRRGGDDGAIRVGFTCSKKVGNAVTRNRAKRRLRAAARELLPELGRPGYDYVLIGRFEQTVSRDYASLLGDLRFALRKLHAPE